MNEKRLEEKQKRRQRDERWDKVWVIGKRFVVSRNSSHDGWIMYYTIYLGNQFCQSHATIWEADRAAGWGWEYLFSSFVSILVGIRTNWCTDNDNGDDDQISFVVVQISDFSVIQMNRKLILKTPINGSWLAGHIFDLGFIIALSEYAKLFIYYSYKHRPVWQITDKKSFMGFFWPVPFVPYYSLMNKYGGYDWIVESYEQCTVPEFHNASIELMDALKSGMFLITKCNF